MNLDEISSRAQPLLDALFALSWEQEDDRREVIYEHLGEFNAQDACEILLCALAEAVNFGQACITASEQDPEHMREMLTAYGTQRRQRRSSFEAKEFQRIVEPLDSIPWPTWTDDE